MTISLNFEPSKYLLFWGDCLQLLKTLPQESVDFIFADPPYFLSNGGMSVRAGKQVVVDKGSWDKSSGLEVDFDFHVSWLRECQRVLKPNGSIAVSGTYHSIFQCGFAMQRLGFRVLNDLVWFKPNASPNLSGRSFAASHETVIWASKSVKSRHKFNYEEMRSSEFPGDKLKNPGKQMRSVWSIPTTPKSEKLFGSHPTQKPYKLLERLIRAATSEDEVVLDPFMGSGTTGRVAIDLNRFFVGIEIEKEFFDIASRRLKED